MAKISLNLDERCLRHGMAQVRIRISHRGSNAFIGTGVYVEPQYFLPGSLYDPLHRRTPNGLEKREQISAMVQRVDEWLLNVSKAELQGLSANDIRERCGLSNKEGIGLSNKEGIGLSNKEGTGLSNKEGIGFFGKKEGASSGRRSVLLREEGAGDFLRWFGSYGESRQTEKTRKSYEYAWHVLCDYCSSLGLHMLTFLDIDYARLADIARWLTSTGRGHSTRHMLESYIRAAYKEAQRRHLVSRDHDPYLDYTIAPVPRKEIDTLTAEQMHRIATAEGLPAGVARGRDIAMMSFYLCGANLMDMWEMGKESDGAAVFVRHKIANRDQIPVRIRIEPEMRSLLERGGGTDRLFNFSASYATYDTFQRRVNRMLEGLEDIAGTKVTMAKIRRTWATIAASLDISERVIDKSMGHVDAGVTARHYEQYDWSRTARANRTVIDAVLKADVDACRPSPECQY